MWKIEDAIMGHVIARKVVVFAVLVGIDSVRP
jgi:hypothetical protein